MSDVKGESMDEPLDVNDLDLELTYLERIVSVLRSMDGQTRSRTMRYLNSRFGETT